MAQMRRRLRRFPDAAARGHSSQGQALRTGTVRAPRFTRGDVAARGVRSPSPVPDPDARRGDQLDADPFGGSGKEISYPVQGLDEARIFPLLSNASQDRKLRVEDQTWRHNFQTVTKSRILNLQLFDERLDFAGRKVVADFDLHGCGTAGQGERVARQQEDRYKLNQLEWNGDPIDDQQMPSVRFELSLDFDVMVSLIDATGSGCRLRSGRGSAGAVGRSGSRRAR